MTNLSLICFLSACAVVAEGCSNGAGSTANTGTGGGGNAAGGTGTGGASGGNAGAGSGGQGAGGVAGSTGAGGRRAARAARPVPDLPARPAEVGGLVRVAQGPPDRAPGVHAHGPPTARGTGAAITARRTREVSPRRARRRSARRRPMHDCTVDTDCPTGDICLTSPHQVLQSTLDDLSCLVQRGWGHLRGGHDLFARHEGRRRLRLRARALQRRVHLPERVSVRGRNVRDRRARLRGAAVQPDWLPDQLRLQDDGHGRRVHAEAVLHRLRL